MESVEAAAIRNYLREKRLKTLKNLMKLNGQYNLFLNELREKRGGISEQRKKGYVGIREFWDMRMNLEDRIRDLQKKRDEVVKQIVAIFPKTR